jgi:ABC-type uncharacterized transport system permease subunit
MVGQRTHLLPHQLLEASSPALYKTMGRFSAERASVSNCSSEMILVASNFVASVLTSASNANIASVSHGYAGCSNGFTALFRASLVCGDRT